MNHNDEVFSIIKREKKRQDEVVELIASENFVSKAVMEAQGSCLTNKYAEGYPGKRYYGGCQHIDAIETLAIERAKKLFKTDYHVNVQPHSGSGANQAAYMSVLEPGDTVMAMDLRSAGHLSHGYEKNFSGKTYNFVHYGVAKDTHLIDYCKVMELAKATRPKLIVAGASAYPREINFRYFKDIADEVGALLMCDISHVAGLVATRFHMSPFPYADIITSTTQKTLRGPRGGIIFCKQELAKKVDSAVFPGQNGGPHMHTIASKAVAFQEANTLEFKTYIENVIDNARHLAEILKYRGIKLSTDGTDNHLVILDLAPLGITGKEGETILEELGITTNRNCIPFETCSPWVTSGLRLGTAAITTRGLDKNDVEGVAIIIAKALKGELNKKDIGVSKAYLQNLCDLRPLPC